MKCAAHQVEAVAVCTYCGRALCPSCIGSHAGPRMACSDVCREALANTDRVMQAIVRQGTLNARANAFYCYICGGLSLAAAVVAWFMLPSPFLIFFTAGCGIVLVASGFWFGRTAKRRTGGSEL